MLKVLRYITHGFWIIFLTILTQIGGVVWILSQMIGYKWLKTPKVWKSTITFFILYLICTLFLIPTIAPFFGRVALPLSKAGNISPQMYLTPLLNRHYVKKRLQNEVYSVTQDFQSQYPELKVVYLDANFPFFDGFPLLPHLSHNDGQKIDLAFIYTKDQKVVNHKPALSGYGKFVENDISGKSHTKYCKERGHWQYDYSKYLTLGSREDLQFDAEKTAYLLRLLAKRKATHKILLEPYLKTSLGLNFDNIRFQGCHSVRHDDHVHWQVY